MTNKIEIKNLLTYLEENVNEYLDPANAEALKNILQQIRDKEGIKK